jgi:type II secretory pathway pseudopilin PulG
MARRIMGFALFEVVLGLAVLAIAGPAIARGIVGVTRAVADGRRWTEAAFQGQSVVRELEAAYRAGAPACVLPPAASRAARGVRVAWWGLDVGTAADLWVELRVGPRAGSVDTLRARVTCR